MSVPFAVLSARLAMPLADKIKFISEKIVDARPNLREDLRQLQAENAIDYVGMCLVNAAFLAIAITPLMNRIDSYLMAKLFPRAAAEA